MTEESQFTLFFNVQHGYIKRAAAKLQLNDAVRDVREINGRLLSARVRAASVADLPRVVEAESLRQCNFFLRIALALAVVDGPSPMIALSQTRARRDDMPERWLDVQPSDVEVLLPPAPLLRDTLAAWRAARPKTHPCQTFEIQVSQFGGNDVRIWARMPFIAQLAAQLTGRPEFADSFGSLLYRTSTRNARADVFMCIVSTREFTAFTMPFMVDWNARPGLSQLRFKGLDHPDLNKDTAAAAATTSADTAATTADASETPAAKRARLAAAAAEDDADRADDEATLELQRLESIENEDDGDRDGGVGGGDEDDDELPWTEREVPRRLQRAETILRTRTSSLIVVLDKAFDWHNINAIFRSCDALGVQHVWVIVPLEGFKGTSDSSVDMNRRINKGMDRWLSVRVFKSRKECIAALRAEPGGLQIWACDVNDKAFKLELPPRGNVQVPPRVALVMGHERTGVSPTMLAAADAHVYLPMFGFGSSLNLSVATALIVQRVFDLAPHFRGQMSDAERRALRTTWFLSLATTPGNRVVAEHFAAAAEPIGTLDDLRRTVIRTRPSISLTRRMAALEQLVEGDDDADAATTDQQ